MLLVATAGTPARVDIVRDGTIFRLNLRTRTCTCIDANPAKQFFDGQQDRVNAHPGTRGVVRSVVAKQ
jgi:hypothetical protein